MVKTSSRLLLALSAIVMAAGGLLHARAFDKTVAALADSNLATFYANALKALWLVDSATLLTLSVVFALIAGRPSLATRPVIMVLAVVPAATAFFLYKFIGNFVPAHMLMGSAIAAVAGGLVWGRAPANCGDGHSVERPDAPMGTVGGAHAAMDVKANRAQRTRQVERGGG